MAQAQYEAAVHALNTAEVQANGQTLLVIEPPAVMVAPVAGTEGEESEAVTLSGLQPCTTYHYQAEAENEANEGAPGMGGDQVFTTACTATVVTCPA